MDSAHLQDEIDHYWHTLSTAPGGELCGWLKDKLGVSQLGALVT